MTERHILKLTERNRQKARDGIDVAIQKGRSGKTWTLELRERTRTDEQNDALHGLIYQILKQRQHLHGVRMSKESYKAIFMHALGQEMPMLPTLDGDGFFPAGLRSSKLTVGEFSSLIEIILAWCAKEGLVVEHFDEAARDGGVPNTASPRAA